MTTKTKIAIVRPGVHTLDEQFCLYLANNNYDVTLIAPLGSKSTLPENERNYQLELLPSINLKKIADFPILPTLYSYLTDRDFDIVQSNEDFQFVTWIAALYAVINHKKLYLIEEKYLYPRFWVHRLVFKLFQCLVCPFVWRSAEVVICHSTACLDFMHRVIVDQALQQKLIFLPVGVNTKVFHPVKDQKQTNRRLKILSVGRLIHHKNFSTLVSAIAGLIEKGIPVSLTIVGRGPLRNEIDKQIADLNLKGRVKIIDQVPFEKLYKVYSDHDLFILSSVLEMVGAAITEAMACGLPIIVSDVGGMTDFVYPGKNGYIYTPGNIAELEKRVQEIYDQGRIQEFGRRSRQIVQEEFSWEVVIPKYIQLFNK